MGTTILRPAEFKMCFWNYDCLSYVQYFYNLKPVENF